MRVGVQLQPSPSSMYCRDMSAMASASAAAASRMPGTTIMLTRGDCLNSRHRCPDRGAGRSLSGLVDDVDLLGRLDNFPGANKAPGNDHAVTRRDGHGVAGGVGNNADSLQDLAVLLLGVGDVPFANLAAPQPGEELSAGVGVVLPHALAGIARDQLLTGQEVLLCGRARGFELADCRLARALRHRLLSSTLRCVHSLQAYRCAPGKADGRPAWPRHDADGRPTRRHNWGTFWTGCPPHRKHRTCTRTNKCAPPASRAADRCCRIHNWVGVAASGHLAPRHAHPRSEVTAWSVTLIRRLIHRYGLGFRLPRNGTHKRVFLKRTQEQCRLAFGADAGTALIDCLRQSLDCRGDAQHGFVCRFRAG